MTWFIRGKNRFLWAVYNALHSPVIAEGNEPGKQDQKPKGGPGDGPPDLDELWNDFNRRLGNLFGGKNQKPSGPTQGSSQGSSEGNSQGAKDEPEELSVGGNVVNNQNENPKSVKGLGSMAQDWIKKNMNNSGNSGNSGGNGKGFQFPNIGVGLLLGLGFVIWLFSGIFIVQEGQAGIVLQFGKYSYTSGPGINWRLPYPIQTHEVVNVSNVRSVEIGRSFVIQATNLKDSSMLTEDENIIDVKFAVQYRLKDPTDYLFKNRDPDGAVIQAAETAIREIVGKSKMDDVLYEGRERIAIELSASIQKILDSYRTGILVTSVNVQNVQPPEQVQASFDDAVKAGQDQERQKNEGQAYANDVIPRAKGAAARLIEEAEGYKARVVATAEGDASRFKQIYTEYSKAPQITRERMYIDVMQQIYNNVTKVVVDTKSGNQLLYLPLDKLIQQTNPPNEQSAAVQPPSGSITVPLTNSNGTSMNSVPNSVSPGTNANSADKRDSFRSRDRENR